VPGSSKSLRRAFLVYLVVQIFPGDTELVKNGTECAGLKLR